MNILQIPYMPRDLNEEIKKELKKVCKKLRKRNGKLVNGDEYELSKECYYRGMLMGTFVFSLYFFKPSYLRSKEGTRIFVADNFEDAQFYANYYAGSPSISRAFEERVKRETGWNIPNGGGLVVEIPKRAAKKSRIPPQANQPGIPLEGVLCKTLTENCKDYILNELGLDKDSLAYNELFDE